MTSHEARTYLRRRATPTLRLQGKAQTSTCAQVVKLVACRVATILLFLCIWLGIGLTLDGRGITLSFPEARADNVQYAYDAVGRVIEAVNSTTGQATAYTYDPAGNITATQTVAVGTLSIAGFSTNSGPSGSQITIYGTGFNPTASGDTVWVNGVQATIVSATQTQLIVVIPAGASSGAIKVSDAGGTITSTAQFKVVTGTSAPTISSFAPTLGPSGTQVIVSGTNFQPLGQDKVVLNQSSAPVTAASSTSITTSVPAGTASGNLAVTTPYGTVVSSSPFFVVPSGYTASSVGTTGVLTIGTASNVALGVANKIAIETFSGTKGQYLTIGIDSNTTSSATIAVYAPNGSLLTSGSITSSATGFQIPQLPASGNYTVLINSASNTGSLNLTLLGPTTGALAIDGTSLSVALAPPGRRTLITFSGSVNQYITLTASNVSLTSSTLSIINPDGSLLTSRTLTAAGGTLQPQLPYTGQYQVLIDPTGSLGGTLQLGIQTATQATMVAGSTATATLSQPGQSTQYSFTGTTGQYLTLNVNEAYSSSATNRIAGATVSIFAPNGSVVASGTLSTTTSGGNLVGDLVVNLGPLPASGIYTVLVQPTGTGTGTLSVALSAPLNGTLTAGSGAVAATLSQPGRGAQYSFAGTAGQYLTLNVNEAYSSSPLNQIAGATVSVFAPNGTVMATGTLSTTTSNGSFVGDLVMNLGPLPASGTYTALIQQSSPGATTYNAATGTLFVTLSAPLSGGTLAAGSGAVAATLSQPGRGAQYSFAGTAGQYLTLNVNEAYSSSPLNQIAGAVVSVFSPNGTVLTTGTLSTTTSYGNFVGDLVMNLGPLPVSGIYTVLIQQASPGGTTSNTATGTLTVTLSAPLNGTLTIGSGAVATTLSQPGQGAQYSFTGTAGQYLTLNVNEIAGSSPPNQIAGATVSVFAPNGTVITTSTLSIGSNYYGDLVMNLGPLPASGAYTVLIQQSSPGGVPSTATGTLTVTLSAPLNGTLTIGSGAVTTTLSQPGQSAQYSFTGTAGQHLALNVNEAYSSSPPNQIAGATVSVFAPSGTVIATGTLSTTTSYGSFVGNLIINLGLLPTSGSYTVLIQQSSPGGTPGSATGALTLTLSAQ